jgi:hypothetical protein
LLVRERGNLVLSRQLRALLAIARHQRSETGVAGVPECRQHSYLSDVAEADHGVSNSTRGRGHVISCDGGRLQRLYLFAAGLSGVWYIQPWFDLK